MLKFDFAKTSPYINKIMQAVSDLIAGNIKEFTFRSDCSLNNPERYSAICDLIMTTFTEACSGMEAGLRKPINPLAENIVDRWLKANDYESICQSAKLIKGPVPNGYLIEGSVALQTDKSGNVCVAMTMHSLLINFDESGELTASYPISIMSVFLSQFQKEH